MKQINLKSRLFFRPLVALFSVFVLQAFYIDNCSKARKEKGYKKPNDFQALLPKSIRPSLQSFHNAADRGELGKVQFILRELDGLDEKSREMFLNSLSGGTTALGKAIAQRNQPGYKLIIQLLCQQKNINLHNKGQDLFALLCIASEEGWLDVVKKLLSSPGDISAKSLDINARDNASTYQWTPLMYAAAGKHSDVVALLIDQGADPNKQDTDGDTALHLVARRGYGEVIKQLLVLKDKINVNAKNNYKKTPLYEAAYKGHEDAVRYLLQVPGIDLSAKGYVDILQWAALNGYGGIVRIILDSKVNVNVHVRDGDGNTLLHLAAEKGYAGVVASFLEAPKTSIDVNAKNGIGDTPLHVAAREGHIEVITELLKSVNTDVTQKNDQHQLPMDLLKQNESVDEEVVKSVLSQFLNHIQTSKKRE
ncbi:ankyrin repeat domain-containing protein [Cardinium endosymbiont of Philonthus spinipes]|uniref:ankyrin repeat domain-containing protein n=1 Tax=Cardinium endosymbiont of Philonthus spinipes TaxID=3077941 RepID=UPI00313D4F24